MPLLDDMRITRLSRSLPIRLMIALAKGLGYCLPVRNHSSLFFFFPFLHVGGAERVHAALTGSVADRRPWIFFTKRSENRAFRPLFPARARLFDIWYLLKYGYPFSVGIMAGLINRHRAPVVFGSNSLFFYLLLPHLRRGVKRFDLLHAFGGGPELYSLGAAHLLDQRVVITPRTRDDLASQYRSCGLDPQLATRIRLIENCVDLPEAPSPGSTDGMLHILFVGRGSPEKRVHLVGKIAARCAAWELPVRVSLAGDTAGAVQPDDRGYCRFLGEVSDRASMERIYDQSQLLLLTSSREGFPLVVMEAMAHGLVTIATDVGGISHHLRHGINGFLVKSGEDEERMVEEFCDIIGQLCHDRRLVADLSKEAAAYAREHFNADRFRTAYRRLLLEEEIQR